MNQSAKKHQKSMMMMMMMMEYNMGYNNQQIIHSSWIDIHFFLLVLFFFLDFFCTLNQQYLLHTPEKNRQTNKQNFALYSVLREKYFQLQKRNSQKKRMKKVNFKKFFACYQADDRIFFLILNVNIQGRMCVCVWFDFDNRNRSSLVSIY